MERFTIKILIRNFIFILIVNLTFFIQKLAMKVCNDRIIKIIKILADFSMKSNRYTFATATLNSGNLSTFYFNYQIVKKPQHRQIDSKQRYEFSIKFSPQLHLKPFAYNIQESLESRTRPSYKSI